MLVRMKMKIEVKACFLAGRVIGISDKVRGEASEVNLDWAN